MLKDYLNNVVIFLIFVQLVLKKKNPVLIINIFDSEIKLRKERKK